MESAKCPTLTVLCGPSHCGKTSFARLFGGTVVSSDDIRVRLGEKFGSLERKVWRKYEAEKRRAMCAHEDIILDACHMTRKARRFALSGAAGYFADCIVFDLSLEALRRLWETAHRLPWEEVERVWRDFQQAKPTSRDLLGEGFDRVWLVASV